MWSAYDRGISEGPQSSAPGNLQGENSELGPESLGRVSKIVFDQRVFFSATREDIGTELCWNAGVDTTEIYPVSSQTLETSKVPATSYGFYEINRYVDDFTQAGAGSNPTDFTKFGQYLFFVANSSTDVDQYRSLYLMGPDLVPQIESMFLTRFFPLPNDDYYNVRELTLHNGELWFIASDKSNPESGYVWKITQNLGMFNVVNVYIPPAENDNHPHAGELESCGTSIAVKAERDSNTAGPDLIYLIGAAGNRSEISGHNINQDKLYVGNLTYNQNKNYLYFTSGIPDPKGPPVNFLWRRSLSAFVFAPVLLAIDGTYPSSVEKLYSTGDFLYFSGIGSNHTGRELWRTNGLLNNNQTRIIKNLNAPDDAGSDPTDMVAKDGYVYFLTQAVDGIFQNGLYRSNIMDPDGDTGIVGNGPYPAIGSIPMHLTLLANNKLYFSSDNGNNPAVDSEPWESDGSEQHRFIELNTLGGSTPSGFILFAPPSSNKLLMFYSAHSDNLDASHNEVIYRELRVDEVFLSGN